MPVSGRSPYHLDTVNLTLPDLSCPRHVSADSGGVDGDADTRAARLLLLDALTTGLESAVESFEALQLPAPAMMRILVRISKLVDRLCQLIGSPGTTHSDRLHLALLC